MYTSPTIIFGAISVLVHAIAAATLTPPLCLLEALGVQPNPADLTTLCGSGSSAMEGNITSKCTGSDESDAMSAYLTTCSVVGLPIPVSSAVVSSSVTTDSESIATASAVSNTTSGAATTVVRTSASSTTASSSGIGYNTGNSTNLAGVAHGTASPAPTSSASSTTAPISAAARDDYEISRNYRFAVVLLLLQVLMVREFVV